MSWKPRFFLLAAVAVPAFTGYPVNALDGSILPGITWGWIGYFLTVHTLIRSVLGATHAANVVSVASLITLPVVFVGGTVSYLMVLAGIGHAGGPAAYSAHYVSLCLTMLTVIPLALSMVAVIPFHRIEQNLLLHPQGVSTAEKVLLMFLRVFNHIIHAVIPNIVEVMREEQQWQIALNGSRGPHRPSGHCKRRGIMVSRLRVIVRAMRRIGIEGICAAVQHIPLWAVEISQLPDKKTGDQ